MKRVSLAIASILAMGIILIAVPAGLIAVAGNPLADITSWGEYLTSADIGSQFLLKVFLPLVGWLAWASFAFPLIAEIITVSLRRPSLKLPAALSWQQGLAAVLIGLVISTSVGASVAPAFATSPSSVSTTAQVNPQTEIQAAEHQDVPAAVRYQVHGYETLQDIAQKTMGDANRYVDILNLNFGQPQADGAALDQTQVLHEGWVLTLPQDAQLPAPVQKVVTVQQGDTLSGIAEQNYGSYQAYHQIAAENAGMIQADGTALTDADMIQPGWQLRLPGEGTPAASQALAPAAPHQQGTQDTHTPQDTNPDLSQVPQSPPQDSAPSSQEPAPDTGQLIPAPDSVDPAQHGADGSAAQPSPQAPAPSASAPSESAPSESSSAQVPQPESSAPQEEKPQEGTPKETSSVPEDSASAGQESAMIPGTSNKQSSEADPQDAPVAETSHTAEDKNTSWMSFAGVGAILAGGILAAVAARRFYQRRRRAPGQERSYSDGAYDTYTAIAHESYPENGGASVEDIHRALMILSNHAYDHQASLPELNLITADHETITLYLAAPASLPFPYTPREDHTVWDIALTDIPAYVPEAPAPYPALATLGTDQQQRLILLNVEQATSLSVNAPAPVAASIFAAYAAELVANPWGENLRLSLLGHQNQLAQSLGGSRVNTYGVEELETCIRALEAEAVAAREFLTRHGYDSAQQIPLSVETETFTPHIVMVSENIDEASRLKIHKIIQGIPRAALAVVSQDTPGSAYTITASVHPHEAAPQATLEPLGISFTPQYLSDEQLQATADLLDETAQDPAAAAVLSEETSPADIPAYPTPDTATGENLENAADELLISQYLTPTTASQLLAPTLTDGQSIGSRHPFLALLGPVRLLDPAGQAPTGANGQPSPTTTARTVAVTAFLNLHPDATTEQYHQAFWPDKHYAGKSATSSRNKLTNQTRTYLGKDSEGHDYLPHAGGTYRLSPSIISDWDIFQHLIGHDIASASTTNLFAALKLVRGAPLSGVKERHYPWAEAIRETMLDTIIDVAYELATRSLKTGDTQTARIAARIGRELDPANEALWRASLHAESVSGNRENAQQLVQDLTAYLEQFEDEMTEQTEQLIHDLDLVDA